MAYNRDQDDASAAAINSGYQFAGLRQLRIVFVCTGNQCRSPIAECAARDYVFSSRTPGVGQWAEIISAGTHARSGAFMDQRAIAELDARRIPHQTFRSQRLTRRVTQGADLIVGMTISHVESIMKVDPTALRRTATLNQVARWALYPEANLLTDIPQLRRLQDAEIDADIPDPVDLSDTEFSEISRKVIFSTLRMMYSLENTYLATPS